MARLSFGTPKSSAPTMMESSPVGVLKTHVQKLEKSAFASGSGQYRLIEETALGPEEMKKAVPYSKLQLPVKRGEALIFHFKFLEENISLVQLCSTTPTPLSHSAVFSSRGLFCPAGGVREARRLGGAASPDSAPGKHDADMGFKIRHVLVFVCLRHSSSDEHVSGSLHVKCDLEVGRCATVGGDLEVTGNVRIRGAILFTDEQTDALAQFLFSASPRVLNISE